MKQQTAFFTQMCKVLGVLIALFGGYAWAQPEIELDESVDGQGNPVHRIVVKNLPSLENEVATYYAPNRPHYHVFFEYGDGLFGEATGTSVGAPGTHTTVTSPAHKYTSSGVKSIRVIATPIYSKNERPTQVIGDTVTPNDTVAFYFHNYINSPNPEARNFPSYGFLTEKDDLTFAVVYQSFNSQPFGDGSVAVYFGDPAVKSVEVGVAERRYHGESTGNNVEPSDPFLDEEYSQGVIWDFTNLGEAEERVIFLDMVIGEGEEIEGTEEIPFLTVMRNSSGTPVHQAQGVLLITAGRDPNNLIGAPNPLCDTATNQLAYTLNFLNEGSAVVNDVRLDINFDPLLDRSTFNLNSIWVANRALVPGDYQVVNGGVPTLLTIQIPNASLAGLNDPNQTNDFGTADYAFGKLTFTIDPITDFSGCSEIISNLDIIFNAFTPVSWSDTVRCDCASPTSTQTGPAVSGGTPSWLWWMFLLLIVLGILMVWSMFNSPNP